MRVKAYTGWPGNGKMPALLSIASLSLHRLDIQTPPQIPARNRAIRYPRFRDLLHHRGLRPLTFLVVLLDGGLYAVIAGRQNIRTPQCEHQEHVRRPDAYAFDLGEMRAHFFFRGAGHALELQQPSFGLLAAIDEIHSLLTGTRHPSQSD